MVIAVFMAPSTIGTTQTSTTLPTLHCDVFVSDDGRGWRQVRYLWLK